MPDVRFRVVPRVKIVSKARIWKATQWTRLEEICSFAEQMGYKKIGLGHCVGMTSEAKQLKDILEKQFTMEAVGSACDHIYCEG